MPGWVLDWFWAWKALTQSVTQPAHFLSKTSRAHHSRLQPLCRLLLFYHVARKAASGDMTLVGGLRGVLASTGRSVCGQKSAAPAFAGMRCTRPRRLTAVVAVGSVESRLGSCQRRIAPVAIVHGAAAAQAIAFGESPASGVALFGKPKQSPGQSDEASWTAPPAVAPGNALTVNPWLVRPLRDSASLR